MPIKFVGKPTGHFLDDARWTGATVDVTLLMQDDEGEKPIDCRISFEALADALGESQGDALDWYRRLKGAIATSSRCWRNVGVLYERLMVTLMFGTMEDLAPLTTRY